MKLAALAAMAAALYSAGAPAIADEGDYSTALVASLDITASAYGLDPGHVYTVEIVNEQTTYCLGMGSAAVRPNGYLRIPFTELDSLTSGYGYVAGDYELQLHEPADRWCTGAEPATSPTDGKPLEYTIHIASYPDAD